MRYCSFYDETFSAKVWKCNQKVKQVFIGA